MSSILPPSMTTGSVSEKRVLELIQSLAPAGGGGGGSSTSFEVTVPLSQAQLRTMFSVPVVVVPGVAGKVIIATDVIFAFYAGAGMPSMNTRFGWSLLGTGYALNDQGFIVSPGVGTTWTALGGTVSLQNSPIGTNAVVMWSQSPDPTTLVGTGQVIFRYSLL